MKTTRVEVLRFFPLIRQVSHRCYNVISRCGYMLFPGLSMCVRNQSKFPRGPGVFPSFLVISQRNLGQHFNLPSADEPESGAAQKSRFLLWLKRKCLCDFEYEGDFLCLLHFSLRIIEKKKCVAIIVHYWATPCQISLPDDSEESRVWGPDLPEEEKEGGIYLCASKAFKNVLAERNVEIGSD